MKATMTFTLQVTLFKVVEMLHQKTFKIFVSKIEWVPNKQWDL